MFLTSASDANDSSFVWDDNEEGIVFVLFALLIFVIVMIVAVVVDLGKEELALSHLRQAADAAALSGARQLNGRPDGWRAAKLAAAIVLRRYPIHGVNPATQQGITLSEGSRAFWDMNPPLEAEYVPGPLDERYAVAGSADGFHIRVERGVVRAKTDSQSEHEFVSLEPQEDGDFMSSAVYLFANAVRVEVRIDKLPGVFTKVFGTSGFENLEARSFAVMDSNLERLVAPIAISAQDLMLDTSPRTFAEDHQLPWFNPESEYGREVEVGVLNKTGRAHQVNRRTELDADPTGQLDARAFINEGVTRSRSFNRLPYTRFYTSEQQPDYPPDICYQGEFSGVAQNCKAVPIEAYFAMPGPDEITPERLLRAFEHGIPARIGQAVTGMENLGALTSDPLLASRFAQLINGSETTFQNFFVDEDGLPKPNYPFLRTTRTAAGGAMVRNPARPGQKQDPQFRPDAVEMTDASAGYPVEEVDLVISYPSLIPKEQQTIEERQRMLMGEMSAQGTGDPPVRTTPSGAGQLNFINPMCHFDSVPINEPQTNKVREVYAMVVAPRKNLTENGQKVNYRDFAAMFSGAEQNAVAEVRETVPTIIGFVKIGVFDGNTLALNVKFPVPEPDETSKILSPLRTSTPFYGSDAANNYVVDDNPAYLDLSRNPLISDMKNYASKVHETYKCFDKTPPEDRDKCELPGPPPDLTGLANLLQCFDFGFDPKESERIKEAMRNLPELEGKDPQPCCQPDKASCRLGENDECSGCREGGGCCERLCIDDRAMHLVGWIVDLLLRRLETPLRAFPHTHCLYNLRADSDNMNDINSYDPLHPLSAGFGCAGLRGRLAYISPTRENDHVTLVSGLPWSRQSPALIDVPEER